MSYNYNVSYSTSASGPWTAVGTTTALNLTISGLAGATNYYVRIVVSDPVSGNQSAPCISGPFETLPASVGVPTQAAAVGYTLLTSTGTVLNTNWFGLSGSSLTQNSDGSITDAGGVPNQYNAHCSTVNGTGGNFQGVAFAGGGYFECTFSFTNPPSDGYQGTNGWPSWWATSVESDSFSGVTALPNGQNLEYDACEYLDQVNDHFNATDINWVSGTNVHQDSEQCPTPSGFDPSQPHKYGWLWVPATSTTQGYIKSYIDNVQTGPTFTWNQCTNPSASPGSSGNPYFSIIDRAHQRLWFGSGTKNVMTVYNVNVWQATDANNMRSGVALPGSGPSPSPPPSVTPTFSENFTSYNANVWSRESYTDGDNADVLWVNDPALLPLVYTYTNGILNEWVVPTPSGATQGGVAITRPYIGGILETADSPNNFHQLYGYFEVVAAVDKLIGMMWECLILSSLHWPPNFQLAVIFTDASNVMHVQQWVSGGNPGGDDIVYETLSTSGFDPTQFHSYGLNWTATTIEFYIDRVLTGSIANPGGYYNTDPCYTKMACQAGAFWPVEQSILNPSALPLGAHIDSYTIWPSKPF